MLYVSTRGQAPKLGFKDALLVGLASDGGLYVPESWPQFTKAEITAFRGKPYTEVAFQVMSKFVDGEIADDVLRSMIQEAYATFRHTAVTPLVQMGPNDWLLELFHGPTLAFKDVAMQILARLINHVLEERDQTLTIVGATSGDTGGAALEAFKGLDRIDCFFMFPDGKVSDFQRKQMTTVGASNCYAIALDGSFDDCQNMVKAMFTDRAFADAINLSAVNSINWGRVMAQVVYYFTAACAVGGPDKELRFTVPTGNFGDIYAGFVAKQMGLPIEKLIIATNENDILARCLSDGAHHLGEALATITPSMDIQISSNFERLLFEASGRDAATVSGLMGCLKQSGGYDIPGPMLEVIKQDFAAGSCSQAETRDEMARCLAETGYLCDPHTAVALHVAAQQGEAGSAMITLSTAHPVKFAETVKAATAATATVPAGLGALSSADEILTKLPNDQTKVQNFVLSQVKQAEAVG